MQNHATHITATTRQTAIDLRLILAGLGADEQLLRGVVPRTDYGGREYVHVPDLPVALVAHLVRLIPVVTG